MTKNKTLYINILWTILYAVVTLFFVLRHEVWADEAQVWLLVKQLSLPGLFKHLVNEGHPSFFYLLVMPFAKLGFSIFSMQIICWLSSCVSVFLFLQFSPFGRFTKFAVLISAGFLYFFPVIARSYSILPLLVFATAILYKKVQENPQKYSLPYAVVLAMLANTHVIMFVFVFVLGCYFVEDYLIKNKNSVLYSAAGIIFLGLLAVVVQLCGTFSSNQAINLTFDDIPFESIKTILIFFLNSIGLVYKSEFVGIHLTTYTKIAALSIMVLFVVLNVQLFFNNKKMAYLSWLAIGFQLGIYIFSYKEVKKENTFSQNRDGITYIQVELNDDLQDKDAFWSKFKHGIATFKAQLPQNVVAVQVMDDFGDTSALLITMESEDKTYRELNDYMDILQDRLRCIPSVGRITVSGMQQEQISVYLDNERLSQYGLNDQSLALTLMQKGFAMTGGKLENHEQVQPVYIAKSLNTVYDVQQQIVYTDPQGNIVRLKDVARVVREYPKPDSYITNNGKKCLLLSIEMKKGQDIVAMGKDINKVLVTFQREELPSEVNIFRITDQSQVVGDSVTNFLKELLIAIAAVVIVVMLLLPLRVALVAASTIPITIFISLGLLYGLDFELNTVSLAALIVTLGMIVDNSIVIIDSYLEKLGEGKSRWHASIESTTHFFKSILSATAAISITFFPFLLTTSGMLHDFLLTFPWTISLILLVSLLVATLLVPFLQFWFIRKPMQTNGKSFSFLDLLQRYYNRLIDICFQFPKTTVALGLGSIVLGALLIGKLPQQMMPTADRNQFAVEIYLPTGTALEQTSQVADSLEHLLRQAKDAPHPVSKIAMPHKLRAATMPNSLSTPQALKRPSSCWMSMHPAMPTFSPMPESVLSNFPTAKLFTLWNSA